MLFDGRSIVAWPDGTAVVAPAWTRGVLLTDCRTLRDAHGLVMAKLFSSRSEELKKDENDLLDAIVISGRLL